MVPPILGNPHILGLCRGYMRVSPGEWGVKWIRVEGGMEAATVVIWGFSKIRGTFLGVPIIRTMVFWGLYWGPPI